MFCSGNTKWINQLAFCVHIQLRIVCGAIDLSTSMGVFFVVVVIFVCERKPKCLSFVLYQWLWCCHFWCLPLSLRMILLPVGFCLFVSSFYLFWCSNSKCAEQKETERSQLNDRHKLRNSWYYKFIIFSHQKALPLIGILCR